MTSVDIQKFVNRANITVKAMKKNTEEMAGINDDLREAICTVEQLSQAFTGKIKNGK